MFKPSHFYLVFNPMINQGGSFLTQAHEFHASLKSLNEQNPAEQNFLYWGKLKVNGEEDSEFNNYQKIISQNKENGFSTHLYITDFHHYWVGKVESVHHEIFNPQKTLSFYDDKEVGVWFKISDFDLVSAEFEETLFYLSQLKINQHGQTQSISPYLGNLKFPAIVSDQHAQPYFSTENYGLRVIKPNALIETPNQAAQLKSHMKSFVLSPQVYAQLNENAKSELLNVELQISRSQYENYSQLHLCMQSYLNIFESVLNQTVGEIIKSEYGESLFINPQSTLLSASESKEFNQKLSYSNCQLSLESFSQIFSENDRLGNISFSHIMERFPEYTKFVEKNVAGLICERELDLKQNALKEGQKIAVSKQEVISIRNQILGVGCVGVINQLMEFKFAFSEIYYSQKAS